MIPALCRNAALLALSAVCLPPLSAQETPEPQAILSAEDVRSDLSAWLEWTSATHPDLSYSVEDEALRNAAAQIAASLPDQLTKAEAWKRLALLNPLFNDAHIGLMVPPASTQEEDAVDITIVASPEGLMAQSNTGALSGSFEISAFNGVAWDDLSREAHMRLRGENESLRRFIIERRTHGLLRVLLPEGEVHSMTISGPDGNELELPVDASRLRFLAGDASAYSLTIEGDTATLFVPSFARERGAEFEAFLAGAFAEIAGSNSTHLVIDISENGGGAHDLSDRLMAYLTDQPFAATSAITARITPENQALVPGSQLQDVLTVPFADEIVPPADLAHRFTGKITIELGAKSYSQAIVFAATAQDAGIAQLSGIAPDAPANQTGQVQTFTLPNTGFTVRAPIYIFHRSSGDRSRDPLKIDALRSP